MTPETRLSSSHLSTLLKTDMITRNHYILYLHMLFLYYLHIEYVFTAAKALTILLRRFLVSTIKVSAPAFPPFSSPLVFILLVIILMLPRSLVEMFISVSSLVLLALPLLQTSPPPPVLVTRARDST